MTDIQDLGLRVRECYIKHKTKQIGRPYRPSPKLDTRENWVKAATKCELLGATIEDFVEAIFSYGVGKDCGGPYINHLYSKLAAPAYEKFASDGMVEQKQSNELYEEISSARDQIVSAIRGRDLSPEAFLLIDTLPMRAIVRLFLSPNSGRIWRKYSNAAKTEMLNDPALEKTLKELKFNVNKLYEFNRFS